MWLSELQHKLAGIKLGYKHVKLLCKKEVEHVFLNVLMQFSVGKRIDFSKIL